MIPQTFIFIGRSGSGKGTQADMIAEYLKQADPAASVFRAETGKRFRDFMSRGTYTSELSGAIYKQGGIQPEFLAIAVWANAFIEGLQKGQHIVIDGFPRKIHEAQVLDSAMVFYGRTKPHVICLNVSDSWAHDKLLARKRFDDTEADIKVRLGWYETDVKPTIEFYRAHPGYHFIEINGEQAIEKVHQDIVAQIKPQ